MHWNLSIFLALALVSGSASESFAESRYVTSHKVTPSNAAEFNFEVLASRCLEIKPQCQFLVRVPKHVEAASLFCRDTGGTYLSTKLNIFKMPKTKPNSLKSLADHFFVKPFRGVVLTLSKDSFSKCSVVFSTQAKGWPFEEWTLENWQSWAEKDPTFGI